MKGVEPKQTKLLLVPVGPNKETRITGLPITAKPLKVIKYNRIPHLVLLLGVEEETLMVDTITITVYMLKENQPFPYSPDITFLGTLDLNDNNTFLHFIAI